MVRPVLCVAPALLLLPFVCCGGGPATAPADDNSPPVVEIREYMGERLHSTNDMRENSIKGPQPVDIESWRLSVEGLVDSPLEFTYDDLLARERVKRIVWVHCVDGWSAKILWEGFSLRELLDEAGARNEARYAVFHGADGFHNYLTVSFIRVNDIIVAHHANGAPLRENRGFPLHVVAQSKYGYKWCKWLTRIVLTDSADGSGYYENSGYSREGDVGDHPYDPVIRLIEP